MDQRISLISLAVRDVAASRAFYCDGLGWTDFMYVEGDVCMIRTGDHLLLSLWDETHFEAELGQPIRRGEGLAPVTLSHNVATRDEVDRAQKLLEGDPDIVRWSAYIGGGAIRKNETLDAAFARISAAELGRACARRDARLLGVYEHFYGSNFMQVPGIGHNPIARDTASAAVQWMAERFADMQPPNDCSAL